MVKPYRVDFTYKAVEQASIYIAAENADKAKEGALAMLAETDEKIHETAEVVAVEEVKKQEKPTIQ